MHLPLTYVPAELPDAVPALARKLALILARTAGLFSLFPLGTDLLPAQVRAMAAVVVTLVLLQVSPAPVPGPFLLQLCAEGAVGLLAALLCRIPLAAIESGMQMASVGAGLGMASLLDPNTDEEVHALTEMLTYATLLIFFSSGGHHQLLLALGQSLRLRPPGSAGLDMDTLLLVTRLGAEQFSITVQVAAPVLLLSLALHLSLALVSRAAPAVHIFSISMVAVLLCGLITIWQSMPAVGALIRRTTIMAAEYFALGITR